MKSRLARRPGISGERELSAPTADKRSVMASLAAARASLIRLLVGFVAGATLVVLSVTPAMGAAGGTFTGTRDMTSTSYTYRLDVAFTERGVGKKPVNYTLDAVAEERFTVACDIADPTVRHADSSSTTIVPDNGRATGTLSLTFMAAGALACPPPIPDEDGHFPPITPPALSSVAWTNINLTSSTGRVLKLDDVELTLSP